MNIGLTGGIATGKSTVSRLLVERGARLVDADQIAREVVLPGSPILEQVFSRFGQAVRSPDGTLNRKALGAIVFADASARKDLEQLLHPAIRARMRSSMAEAEKRDPDKLVVVDVPLLFESGLSFMFSEVMVVYVPERLQLMRLIGRDGLAEEEAVQRIRAQMPIEEKRRLADIVIDNSGTIEQTREQVDRWWLGKGRL